MVNINCEKIKFCMNLGFCVNLDTGRTPNGVATKLTQNQKMR